MSAKVGDGYLGWPEAAPFDKIIVTCSPEKVPQPLVDQLKDGGLMIVPVGERYQQNLYLYRKTKGELKSEALKATLFVPMTGEAEAKRAKQRAEIALTSHITPAGLRTGRPGFRPPFRELRSCTRCRARSV